MPISIEYIWSAKNNFTNLKTFNMELLLEAS